MARDLYDIERTRRINISIPGYDPVRETKKFQERYKRIRKNKAQSEYRAKTAERNEQVRERDQTEKELTQLNSSLSVGHESQTQQEGKPANNVQASNLFL